MKFQTDKKKIGVTGTSEFHSERIQVRFRGLVPGINYRKLPGPRTRYCLDFSNGDPTSGCGCGFPINRTAWETDAPDYEVSSVGLLGYDHVFIEICPKIVEKDSPPAIWAEREAIAEALAPQRKNQT